MAEHEQQSLIARVWEVIKRAYSRSAPSRNAQLHVEFEQLQRQLHPRNLAIVLWLCDDKEVDEQVTTLRFYDAISRQAPVLSDATLAYMLTVRAELKSLVGPHGELTNDWYVHANAHVQAMLDGTEG